MVDIETNFRHSDSAVLLLSIILFIYLKDSPCVDLPTPLNGAKACETWLAGMMCTVHCNKGYGFANNPDVLYYCKPNGKWWNAKTKNGETTPTPPDCLSKEPELRKS